MMAPPQHPATPISNASTMSSSGDSRCHYTEVVRSNKNRRRSTESNYQMASQPSSSTVPALRGKRQSHGQYTRQQQQQQAPMNNQPRSQGFINQPQALASQGNANPPDLALATFHGSQVPRQFPKGGQQGQSTTYFQGQGSQVPRYNQGYQEQCIPESKRGQRERRNLKSHLNKNRRDLQLNVQMELNPTKHFQDIELKRELEMKKKNDLEIKYEREFNMKQEMEMKRKIELEKKLKQDTEIKRKHNIEMKKKFEMDIKRKQEMEMKRKIELEKKFRHEYDIKRKNDLERKVKQENEINRKIIIELKRKHLIDIKIKYEMDIKKKIELEMKIIKKMDIKKNYDEKVSHDMKTTNCQQVKIKSEMMNINKQELKNQEIKNSEDKENNLQEQANDVLKKTDAKYEIEMKDEIKYSQVMEKEDEIRIKHDIESRQFIEEEKRKTMQLEYEVEMKEKEIIRVRVLQMKDNYNKSNLDVKKNEPEKKELALKSSNPVSVTEIKKVQIKPG